MRSYRFAVLLLTILVIAALHLVAYWRSGIPMEINGRIEAIDVVTDTYLGIDDIHIIEVKGEWIRLDVHIVNQLDVGDRVEKEAWSSIYRTQDGLVVAEPSEVLTGVIPTGLVGVVLSALGLFLTADKRRESRSGSASPEPPRG